MTFNRIVTNTVEVNSLVMIKREQHFAFLYRDDQRNEVLRRLGVMAADPALDFSWYDAAVLGRRVREEAGDK